MGNPTSKTVTVDRELFDEAIGFVDRHSEAWYRSGQDLLARLRAAQQVETRDEWLPMDTAPKDHSPILAYFDYNPVYRDSSEKWGVAVVRWAGEYSLWAMPGISGLSPKCWKPIRYPNGFQVKTPAPLSPAEMSTVARMSAVAAQVQPDNCEHGIPRRFCTAVHEDQS